MRARGVDVISYRNIDTRKGKIILLLQCASGKNWRKKSSDIKPRLWEQLVFWTAAPSKALAFQFAYDFDSPLAEVDWSFYSYDGGILFDRLRLALFDIPRGNFNLQPIFEYSNEKRQLLSSYIF